MDFMPSGRANDDIRSVIPKKLRFELERSRLLAQLEAANDIQLLALIAPSGYGKTTLLAQFARTGVRKAVWLELSEDHADPLVLAHSIVGILRVSQPKLSLEHWSQGANDTASADVLAQLLARDLNRSDDNLNFFLDAVHLIGLDAGRWLMRLMGLLSEGHRFLIAGYDSEHLSLAKLVAQGQALLWNTQDLAFTLEETRAYLLERNVTDDPNLVQTSLEGWAAGLALVASGMSLQVDPADLMLEALKRLPQAVQTALPEAGVCEIWNEEAAARLGCQLPTGWLNVVRRAGLPLTPLGHQTYRPLQVMLEVLQTQLKRNTERHAELSLNAGKHAQAVGDPMRALKHYRNAQLNIQALNLALEVASMLFDRAEFRLLRQLLESFEPEQLPAKLLGFLGIALIETGKSTHGEVLLRKLRSEGQADTQVLYWLGRLAYHEGQFERTFKLAEDGLALQSSDTNISGLLRLKAHALMGLNRPTEALEFMVQAVGWAEDRDNLSELGHNLSSLKLIQYRLGQWFDCEKTILRAMEVYEALGTPVRTLPLLIDLASLRYLQNRATEAFALIEQGISLATREQSRLLSYFLEIRGDVYFWQQEFELAVSSYQQTIVYAKELNDQVLAQMIELKQSEALWRLNRQDQAKATLERLNHDNMQSHTDLQGLYAFYQGIASFFTNDLDAASQHFIKALELSEESSHKPRARAYLTEIARQQNTLELEQVTQLIASLDAMPHDNVLMVDAEPLNALFTTCIERGWFTERFSRFVDQIQPRETQETLEIIKTGFELEILTLGKLQVSLNGTPIRIPFAKAGELLVFIALNGASSREEIMNALWDGSLETRHHEYFRVAARRLRTALSEHPDVGFNPLPFENKLYSLAPQIRSSLDVNLAQQALELGNPQQLQATLEVYKGEFLPGVNTEWVSTIRTRVLEHTVAAAATLGEQLEQTQPREALKIYRRAIELEPLSEVSHLGLIRVHLALGGIAAANQAYGAYARMLSEEFGLVPSDPLRQSLERLGLRVV
jgi:LuxR family transcriptional regulator, maltose regulon positive regulatory protein